jgi:hypothetical protein
MLTYPEILTLAREVVAKSFSGLEVVAAMPQSRSFTELIVKKYRCNREPYRAILAIPRDGDAEHLRLAVTLAILKASLVLTP